MASCFVERSLADLLLVRPVYRFDYEIATLNKTTVDNNYVGSFASAFFGAYIYSPTSSFFFCA